MGRSKCFALFMFIFKFSIQNLRVYGKCCFSKILDEKQGFVNLLQGLLTGSYIKPSKEECLSFCNEEDNCEWFSFNQNQSFCLHFNSCPEIDETFTEYISGESECYQESSCKF